MLRAPDKRLRYSKQHFQGYFLQLHAYLRKDSDTDDYLDGIFTNPITDLVEGHARELKKGADHRDETIMAVVTQLTSLYQEFQVAGRALLSAIHVHLCTCDTTGIRALSLTQIFICA